MSPGSCTTTKTAQSVRAAIVISQHSRQYAESKNVNAAVYDRF
jgi:hypothetical protein